MIIKTSMTHKNRVALVAPETLREAFSVVLRSAPDVELIATAADMETLGEELDQVVPDAVLLYLTHQAAQFKKGAGGLDQIRRLKQMWPETSCITIVKDPHTNQEAKALGADVVFLDGVSPSKLLESIKQIRMANSV